MSTIKPSTMLAMLAPGFAMILAAVLFDALIISNVRASQQKQGSYGPAISAYLTGLDEELNELQYQIAAG